MASFSLVHGAWRGGWCWDPVRAELEARGHDVHTPDLPCEDVTAGVEEYAAAVPAADVVVGHSLGGLTIPLVEARHARLPHRARRAAPAGRTSSSPGFGEGARPRRARALVLPGSRRRRARAPVPGRAGALASRLRRQAPYDATPARVERPAYVVCTRDAVIRPDWQRHLARDVLGVEPHELDAGHSPMLECPRELALLLDALV